MLGNILLFGFLYAFVCRASPIPVDKLDVKKYLGHWYQVYGAPTNVIFQGYGECITADYGLLSNGNISVLNKQVNSKGELEQIEGYGYYKNISEPGKLTVRLDGVPFDSPYWVVKLGEVINNYYQYSIVTTPSAISLWVLVRDIKTYLKSYDKEVVEFLNKNKYKYVTINQNNCN